MRLVKYQYSISHVPEKSLVMTDAMSRAPSSKTTLGDTEFSTVVDAYVNAVMNTLPATDTMLDRIKEEQNSDRSCVRLTKYCQDGWPNQNQLSSGLKPFHSVCTELSLQNRLLTRNSRAVIPKSLHPEIRTTKVT